MNKFKQWEQKIPKNFGNYLKMIKTDPSKISIDCLLDFLNDLITNESDRDEYVNINIIDVDSNNEMLNGKISAEEIKKTVKNSKNSKSSGDNLIINEFFSSSLDCMIDIYVHIFNLIFDTGILPEAWLIRNVIPIF